MCAIPVWGKKAMLAIGWLGVLRCCDWSGWLVGGQYICVGVLCICVRSGRGVLLSLASPSWVDMGCVLVWRHGVENDAGKKMSRWSLLNLGVLGASLEL